MPKYVLLMNLTEQGVKNIKEAPERIESSIKGLEEAGGKLIDFYAVMGQYDYVSIVEYPSDEVASAQVLGLIEAGFVRTTTLRAFSKDEFAEIIKKKI